MRDREREKEREREIKRARNRETYLKNTRAKCRENYDFKLNITNYNAWL